MTEEKDQKWARANVPKDYEVEWNGSGETQVWRIIPHTKEDSDDTFPACIDRDDWVRNFGKNSMTFYNYCAGDYWGGGVAIIWTPEGFTVLSLNHCSCYGPLESAGEGDWEGLKKYKTWKDMKDSWETQNPEWREDMAVLVHFIERNMNRVNSDAGHILRMIELQKKWKEKEAVKDVAP